MAEIFISYRHADSAANSRSLYEGLSRSFGAGRLYFDTEQNKRAGQDYYASLAAVVGSSRAVLAAIGPSWLTVSGPDGTPRLFHPGDIVAFELRNAISARIPIVPVLFDGATIPSAHDLPHGLGALQRLNALEMTHARWQDDLRDIVSEIRDITGLPVIEASPSRNHRERIAKVAAERWEWRGYLTVPPPQARSLLVDAMWHLKVRPTEATPGLLTATAEKHYVLSGSVEFKLVIAYGGTRTTNVHIVCGAPYGGFLGKLGDAVARGTYRKTIEQVIDNLARTGYLGD